MNSGLMYLNMELIDSFGPKDELAPQLSMSNNPSSYGSLVSLESPRSIYPEKRSAEALEDIFRPEKKQRLGRKTKNSGLRAERNRQSAAASRERSKRHLQELERLSVTLPEVNRRLANEDARLCKHGENGRRLRAENMMLRSKILLEELKLAEMERRVVKSRSIDWLL
mmetsp:Transcript_6293/g.19000  ORF Transcript_6293/g.19000 Transcript_6293/m.19000 type:complete len:168 (+) Transcript_6293:447-950(+)